MTGPEHYAKAQELLAENPANVFLAQVHATLALTAATALQHFTHTGLPEADHNAWYKTASEGPAATAARKAADAARDAVTAELRRQELAEQDHSGLDYGRYS